MKDLTQNYANPNCFEKTEAGGAFFIFHQITDELSTKHNPRLRTTFNLRNFSNCQKKLRKKLQKKSKRKQKFSKYLIISEKKF